MTTYFSDITARTLYIIEFNAFYVLALKKRILRDIEKSKKKTLTVNLKK